MRWWPHLTSTSVLLIPCLVALCFVTPAPAQAPGVSPDRRFAVERTFSPAEVATFFEAIEDGDTAAVKRQLDAGISPDVTDAKGVNALYFACDKEQPAMAQLLIAQGANVNLTPRHRSTALQVSIYRGFDSYELKPKAGYPELIQTLLTKGADVNAVDADGNTPLIAAAEKDDVTTLNLLLERGADLSHANENGWTALDRAVSYRRRTIARKLVAAGAPLDEAQQQHLANYQFARRAGGWFPVILVGSFVLAGLMHQRFKALPKPSEAPGGGDSLPNLQPLKCNACGGSASLRPGKATCSHCHEPVPVPEDYVETLKLRERTFKLLKKAERMWKRVRLLSIAPIRWVLWLAAGWFVWRMSKGLFPHFVRDALYDLMTFKGTMAWALGVLAMSAIAIALAGYAIYLASVRAALPDLPVQKAANGKEEDVPCPNCGGDVNLQPSDLVGVCGYCGSETYRTALAREARSTATGEKHAAASSLHEAMVRVYEMRENAALAVPMAILAIGFVLVLVLYVVLLIV
ncbi:ankyrin repeat domain-containing protein [Verrucomicrobium sp. BvORR034]|uniref:ankyrin repeat domain-containing protein n=1 Tax=Verrucomicrobium sp. BvORR034 TaxID=1396418 RepID=UPI00067889DE|nr:ankyrin repeat domain-containing protein [Verrucomicrobium sp. BvORR034]